jgi:ABC-type lipoprotein release transport system permease subunit
LSSLYLFSFFYYFRYSFTFFGVISGYSFWLEDFKELGWSFFVPVGEIAAISFMAFAVSLFCTIPPSFMASRISPAEALRYE